MKDLDEILIDYKDKSIDIYFDETLDAQEKLREQCELRNKAKQQIIKLNKGVNMDKLQKELFSIVKQYVDDIDDHHLDEVAIEGELDDILSEIETLGTRITEGDFDRSIEDMKEDEGCRKYHERVDDEITERGVK